MQNLKDVLEHGLHLDLSGWTLEVATGISADGKTLVGYGVNPSGLYEAGLLKYPKSHKFRNRAVSHVVLSCLELARLLSFGENASIDAIE